MNKKERRLAIASALAATADGEMVSGRGHKTESVQAFPIVVEDSFATIQKSKDITGFLDSIGVTADLARARDGKHVRAGMGTLRARRYKTPKSVLFVTVDGNVPAVRNLTGVDVVSAKNLGAEHLAPGGDMGRLTVFTTGALDELKETYQ